MHSSPFLRVFAFTAIPLGIYFAARDLLRGLPAGYAIAGGLVLGAFFGLIMGLVLSALHAWSVRRRGQDPARTGAAVDVRESLELPLPPDQALERCRAVLQGMRMKDVRVDAAAGTVSGQARMSWASFGERVECSVAPAEGGSRVEVRSRPTVETTVVDYGKNRQNVERILAQLRQAAPGRAA